jgi:hypothetical protein
MRGDHPRVGGVELTGEALLFEEAGDLVDPFSDN